MYQFLQDQLIPERMCRLRVEASRRPEPANRTVHDLAPAHSEDCACRPGRPAAT